MLIAGLCFGATPAFASEPCANEQYRQASNSTQLPDCRAYELVTPADAGGQVDYQLSLEETGNEPSPGLNRGLQSFEDISNEGNLDPQLRGPLDVQGNGEDVFWDSTATPAGTGAIPDGGEYDAFRSTRTSSGWSTQDLLPSGLQTPGGGLPKVVIGASVDGSTALILTPLALQPGAFANPQEASLGSWAGLVIYRVHADGTRPELVTHGDFLLPENTRLTQLAGFGPFQELTASPDLSEVTFRSNIPLEGKQEQPCEQGPGGFKIGAATYLWNASSVDGLAHFILSYRGSCMSPNVAGVPTILPDGRPILMPNPSNTVIPGPLVENNPNTNDPGSLTPLAGPLQPGKVLAVTPDSATAYVLENEKLVTEDNNGGQIYAINTKDGVPQSGLPLPSNSPSVICVSCMTDQTNVTYVGTSKDGVHLLFTTDQGLWEWDASSRAQLLTSATDLTSSTVIVSENGQYVVGLTRQLAHNPNGTADLYEFRAGQTTPTLVTSGSSADTYALYDRTLSNTGEAVASGVSNDGQRVVYNASAPEVGGHQPPQVIDEWDAGHVTQLSPSGSLSGYSVQAVAGEQLQDVFFIAQDPLVPWDLNASQADVYDARAGGGFPFCTPGNPGPPPGAEGCSGPTNSANPTAPPIPSYGADLTPMSVQPALLPADTSRVASTSTVKPLTRAQRLAHALKACTKKPKKKRATCVEHARKQYAPMKKAGEK
jgi:hypothetical protein